jgi:hypothetical protein
MRASLNVPTRTGGDASGTWGISITGNASTATALQTARTIGGVSFDGTANINLPGVNTAGTQNTSGNAASATNVRVDRDDTGDTSMYLTMVNNNTAENSKRLYMDTNLVYDNTNNELKLNSLQITDYIYHSGDTNTYFGFDAADHFRIVEGGGTRFQVDSNGYIGIGTTSPAYTLDVHGTSNVGALTATTATVPNDGGFVMGGKPLNPAAGLHWDRVNSRLGVGTNSPAYKLDVSGTLHAGNSYFDNVYIGGSTSRGLRAVSGNYGTVQTTGGGAGNYEGYSIDGRYVFMSADNNSCGIYNDLDNKWIIYAYRNNYVKLYYAGAEKLATNNGGITVTGSITGSMSTSLSAGSYLTGTAYNGSTARTFNVDATDAATASKVVARDANGSFSANVVTATSVSGNGSGLTSLNASNISSGTLGTARIPNLSASKITTGTLTRPINTSTGVFTHVSLGTDKYPTLGGNWLTIFSPTYDGAIGNNHPDPDGGILFANRSGSDRFPWGYYMGVVKDAASTSSTSLRFDIGKSSDLNSQDSTGGSDSLTPYLTIDNGNVGIGTTSPGYKLDVNGTVNTGALTATSVSGNGSGLTSLNAGNISSGTLTRPISTTTGTFSDYVSTSKRYLTGIAEPYQDTLTNSAAVTAGWYRIAENGNAVNSTTYSGSRCSARFTIIDYASGQHSTRTFYAGGTYGNLPFIHLMTNTSYGGGGIISKVRIVEDNTYEGLAVEIYVDGSYGANKMRVVMDDNYQDTGFTLIDFESVVADHAGMNEYEISLDNCIWGIHHNGGQRLFLKSDGNVGIGTASPGYKLDVNGDIRVSGKIYNYNYTEVDINAPGRVSGTWTTKTTSQWGDPKFNNTYDSYRYNDAPGYVEYTIPAGMKSAYLSQLTWSTGGYVDIHGVQSDGGLVFLRRINTRQNVENSNEGNPDQHDGQTITFAGSGLEHYSNIRLTNKLGRFHLDGLAFTPNENEGTEGTGMVHSAQISNLGTSTGIPTSTGTGANGTWGINITGSSGSCTGNSATASSAATLSGVTINNIFNNMGGTHSNRSDFNAIPDAGAYYVTGSTNGPGVNSATQYYGFTLGLGSDYSPVVNQSGKYGTQIYWGRNVSSPYINIRYLENGSWGSWRKAAAGYADSAGTATNQSGGTVSCTSGTFSGTFSASSASSRDKFRVYPASTYCIGMQSGVTYGDLNDWSMTFQMNNEDDRGFWWGDDGHGVNQGAMSLSTRGRLTVAERIRVGGGQGDTSGPGEALQVINGHMIMTGVWQPNSYYRLMGYNTGKQIQFNYNDGTWISDNNKILFGVGGSQDGKGIYLERMRIANNGNVGVNTTNPTYKMHVNGSMYYAGGGNYGSDDRIKYNEQNVSNALTLISQLQPQKYEKIVEIPRSAEGHWIPSDEEWENVKNEYEYDDEYGFIAQDVRAIPELSFLVTGEETRTDTKIITVEDYSNLTTQEQNTYSLSYINENITITPDEYSNLATEESNSYTVGYTKQIETDTPLGLNYNGIFVVAVAAIQELKAQLASALARLDALENPPS